MEKNNNSEPKFPENIELNKNSKGYTWKIRIFLKDNDEEICTRLKKIDDRLLKDYTED